MGMSAVGRWFVSFVTLLAIAPLLRTAFTEVTLINSSDSFFGKSCKTRASRGFCRICCCGTLRAPQQRLKERLKESVRGIALT
jgi:hypothetical protein